MNIENLPQSTQRSKATTKPIITNSFPQAKRSSNKVLLERSDPLAMRVVVQLFTCVFMNPRGD